MLTCSSFLQDLRSRLKKFFAKFNRRKSITHDADQLGISSRKISRAALTVIEELTKNGHQAYLVGGGVRDLLLGGKPKDFDIGTSATPEQAKAIFKKSRIVGRRFRIVHVRFGREIIEVTTFRANQDNKESKNFKQSESGMLLRDNVYGSVEDDAMRRDFTVNALYYDAQKHQVIDYCDGIRDLEAGVLRMIGVPKERYSEDPVRMLRAARFAAKLQFKIDKDSAKPINDCRALLSDVASARLFDECLKLFMNGYGADSFEQLHQLKLFDQLDQWLFPNASLYYFHDFRLLL